MRFRRRHRSGRRVHRRPGMKGDWITLMKTGCPFPGEAPQPCDTAPESLVATQIDLIEGADLNDKQDALTIVRMVGAINPVLFLSYEVTAPLSSPQAGIASCHEGIYKATSNAAGDIQVLNPFNGDDFALDSWLWLRETSFNIVIGGAQNGFDTFALAGGAGTAFPPSAPQFDVRVKRKLELGDDIVYAAQWTLQMTIVPVAQGGSLPTSVNLTAASLITGALRGYVKF